MFLAGEKPVQCRTCSVEFPPRKQSTPCSHFLFVLLQTAIAEGLAQVLIDDTKCPPLLQGHRLVSIELASIVAGTKYRGEFEERLQAIVKEVTDPKAPPTILFLDELHNLVGAGSAEGKKPAVLNCVRVSL